MHTEEVQGGQGERVQVDAKWVKRINSPLFFVVAVLTGVSATFAPMFLFQLGRSGATIGSPSVLLCLSVIYLVPLFYIRFAGPLIAQVYRRDKGSQGSG